MRIKHAAGPSRGYANALRGDLPDAVAVLDPFHGTDRGTQVLYDVQRRVRLNTLRRRGHRDDPFDKIRGLLRSGSEHRATHCPTQRRTRRLNSRPVTPATSRCCRRAGATWWMFCDPAAKDRFLDWELEAHDLVGRLRARLPTRLQDPAMLEIVARLDAQRPRVPRVVAGALRRRAAQQNTTTLQPAAGREEVLAHGSAGAR